MAETFWGLIGIIAKELQNRGGEEWGNLLVQPMKKNNPLVLLSTSPFFLPKVWIWNSVKLCHHIVRLYLVTKTHGLHPCHWFTGRQQQRSVPKKTAGNNLTTFSWNFRCFFFLELCSLSTKYHGTTPKKKTSLKINMEYNHGGLKDHFPF